MLEFNSPEDYAEFMERYWSEENVAYMQKTAELQTKYGTKKYEKLLDKMSDREYEQFKRLEDASPMWKTSAAKKTSKSKKAVDNSGSKTYNSGVKSGAYNSKNDPWESKRNAHARQYYDSLRNSKKEPVVSVIAKNSGASIESVSKMYDHLFINEYDLDKGHTHFEPDYDIAESIQRLRTGKGILTHDKILIGHESTEYDLMNIYGLSYDEAHEAASKIINYQEAIAKWKDETDGW